MCSIKFSSLFFSLVFSSGYAIVFDHQPVIALIQGVIAEENVLPLSVFWYHPNFTANDWLFVYSLNSRRKFEGKHKIDSYTGFYELPGIAIENGEGSDNYCAVISSERILANNASCESKVQWMYDRIDMLGDFSLKDLVIPGTHHSAAYARSDYESLSEQSLMSRWTLTQTKSIKSQLMDGIRYLDLRPSQIFNVKEKKYMVTHNVVTLITMDNVVEQINEFMDISKDIVIVSMNEFFEGFDSDEDHQNFIRYLERSFAKHAHRYTSWAYTLSSIWDNDRRLIISYGHSTYNLSDFMWPSIHQYWSNSQTINRLHTYFDRLHNRVTSKHLPYVAMVELTHSFMTIAQDSLRGGMSLRHWGQRIGKYIPQWYAGKWDRTANIIAVDFYQASGIVDLAIHINEDRFRSPRLSASVD